MNNLVEETPETGSKKVTKTVHEERYVVKNRKCMVIFVCIVCGIFALAFILNALEGKLPFWAALILLLLLLLLFCCFYTRITYTEEIVVDLDKNRLYYAVNTLKQPGVPTEYYDLDKISKAYINYGTKCIKGANGNQYLSDVCLLMKDGSVKKLVSDIDDEEKLKVKLGLIPDEDYKEDEINFFAAAELNKPCPGCTCGRDKNNQGTGDKKSCGRCYLGDAFRCANCPYRGKPPFEKSELEKKEKESEKIVKSDIKMEGNTIKLDI